MSNLIINLINSKDLERSHLLLARKLVLICYIEAKVESFDDEVIKVKVSLVKQKRAIALCLLFNSSSVSLPISLSFFSIMTLL